MTPQTWLITGGAGYIGAHVADEFLANGKNVVIYDSLYRGLESRIEYLRKKHKKEIPLIVADIRDLVRFEEVLAVYKPHGIIHTAALKAVGESMEKPDEYFEVNHHATAKMLELATKNQIKNFIFSSTAAVYASPNTSRPISEKCATDPASPYGASKLAAESEVNKFLSIQGNLGISLRFFNVVGTSDLNLIDNSFENLVPIVIKKLKAGESPIVYGSDYPTPDGTCIRDYVDVRDVALFHLAIANSKTKLPSAMNIGTGRGTSVKEVINLLTEEFDVPEIKILEEKRRGGDAPILYADIQLLRYHLKSSCNFTLQQSIQSLSNRP